MIECFYVNIVNGNIYTNIKGRKRGSLIYTDAKGDFIKLRGKRYYLNENEQKRLNDFIKRLDEKFN